MDDAIRTELPAADQPAAERYLLLADISGYTGFMAGVELEHGVDFSAGIRQRIRCSGRCSTP